jgi:hypothetical protein
LCEGAELAQGTDAARECFLVNDLCVSSFVDREGAFTMVNEGRQASVKSRRRRVWARRGDGAQDRAVIVPLLEPERNSERTKRGQQAERHSHAHLRALAKDHRIRHPQRLKRSASRENLRLYQCSTKSGHLGERIFLQVRENRWGCDTRGVALEMERLRLRCASRKVRKGLPEAGFSPACQSSTTSPIRRERRFGQRPRRRPYASTGARGE